MLSAELHAARREQDAREWGATVAACRDHALLAVFTPGESGHNNHHAFPSSARRGLMRWELDLADAATRALAFAGLVWRVRTPTEFELNGAAGPGGVGETPR